MRPEASRLVYRIKTALKGESNGLDTANLAWQYAAEVVYAESLLKQCLEKQDDLEAYVAAYSSPSPLDTLDTLNFAEIERWNQRCEKLGWRKAPTIDHARIKELRGRFAAIEDPKSWLLGEFRKQSRAKHPLQALRIAKTIQDRFETDENIAAESKRLDEQVTAIAEGELKSALQDLVPAESPESILARYEDAGIVLPEKDGAIKEAKDANLARHLKEAGNAIDAFVKQSESAESDEERVRLETDYFECDYLLTVTDIRAKLSTKQREGLTKVSTTLSHYRGNAESNILIRSAIKDLRDILQGVSLSFGNKKATAHDAYERLASLRMQANKMGRRIPDDLKEDIRRALSQAKRKRAPKYAIIGGAALALVAAVFWLVNGQVESNRQATIWQEATAAINQAAARQDLPKAKQALAKWQSAIAEAPANHALENAAKSLKDWIDGQSLLQYTYSEIADKLEAIRTANGANPTSYEISALLESATSIRESITAQTDGDNDQKVEQFQSWQVMRLKQQVSNRKQTLMAHMSSAQDQLEQAAAATDTETFEARSKDILEATTNARMLLAEFPELDQNALQQRSLQRIETALTSFQEKRDSMKTAQRTIKDARDLSAYLKSLEAIYNFDTLSSKSKRDIGRILKLESEYGSLLQLLIMPDDRTGWIELGGSGDYANNLPIPDKAEQAYLERLIGNMLFPAIYESKVKYFEGASVAKSEYSVFLVEPIQKGDTAGLKTGINFSFKVRGFDESGEPEKEIREMNFLSHPDGSFWGFFYDPSALSTESLYFQETIRAGLMKIRAGAPRFAAIDLIKDLSDERSLSPAFRAYWQQELIAFIEMNPWKWGLPLSPSLGEQTTAIKKLAPDGIDQRLWLSAVEQTSPSIELTEYFRIAGKKPILQEAKAFSALYAFAMQGKMALVGQADASGKIEYNESKDADDRLWIVNGLTGRIEALEGTISIAPYSPVMAYRFEDQSAIRLIQKTRMLTGIDLSAEDYKGSLPSILK